MNKLTDTVHNFGKGVQVLRKASPLARQALIVKQMIPAYGEIAVASTLIKNIKKDCKKAYKKGGKEKVVALIDNCKATPEYMSLLADLKMNETHLYLLAEEVTGEKYYAD